MDKSYDRMDSHAGPGGGGADPDRKDAPERRLARLAIVAETLGDIGNELKLEMFAQMHDPLVAAALANWSERILDLAVFAHCGSGKAG